MNIKDRLNYAVYQVITDVIASIDDPLNVLRGSNLSVPEILERDIEYWLKELYSEKYIEENRKRFVGMVTCNLFEINKYAAVSIAILATSMPHLKNANIFSSTLIGIFNPNNNPTLRWSRFLFPTIPIVIERDLCRLYNPEVQMMYFIRTIIKIMESEFIGLQVSSIDNEKFSSGYIAMGDSGEVVNFKGDSGVRYDIVIQRNIIRRFINTFDKEYTDKFYTEVLDKLDNVFPNNGNKSDNQHRMEIVVNYHLNNFKKLDELVYSDLGDRIVSGELDESSVDGSLRDIANNIVLDSEKFFLDLDLMIDKVFEVFITKSIETGEDLDLKCKFFDDTMNDLAALMPKLKARKEMV